MRKLLVVLGSLVVVAIVALALLPRLLDVNLYRDRIQTELQNRLGRQVQLGQMSLGIFPPTFKVQNATIAEDPRFNSTKPFAEAAELDIQLKLLPLLHKQVQVASLRMVRPQVELIRAADGTWNFSSLANTSTQQPKQPSGQKTGVQLDRFQISDGMIAVTDEHARTPRVEYDNVDLLLSDFAPDTPFRIALSTHFPGKGEAKLDGTGGPINDATLVSTPFEGTLQLNQIALSALREYLKSQSLAGTDASIGGTLKFKNNNGTIDSTGTVHMDNVVTRGQQLGYPIELDYNTTDDLKTDLIQISNTQLKLGSAPFTINGTVNSKTTPATASLKVNTQNAPLAELVKVAEVFGMSLSPGMQPSGLLTADLTANGPLSGPALAGTLQTAQLKVRGMEANSLQVKLNLAPFGSDVVRTLSGKVNLNMNDGKLTGVDLSQKLSEIGKFTGGSSSNGKTSDGSTRISQLSGDFDLKNGVASTNDLKALTDAGTVAAVGTASLVNQALDMRVTAVLSKTNSQQVGGSAIGGLMKTAMQNQNGELVIPVLVTGTFSNPKVAPDLDAMAKMRMNNLLPSFGNPGQLLQGGQPGSLAAGALGALTGKTPAAAASNQGQSNDGNSLQNAVGGVTGLFGKKKK